MMQLRYFLILLISIFLVASKAQEEEGLSKDESKIPVLFEVQLKSGELDSFVMEIHSDWAPTGAERFLELVDEGEAFWKGIRFFRVISGFMAQFGIPGKPDVAAIWKERKLTDDPVKESNKRGYVSFATSGENSRTTQMFINLADNTNLDGMGFSPFAYIDAKGMDVVERIYSGYGEGAPNGKGPDQGQIQSEGNKYLKRQFPKLSYIKSVKRLSKIIEDTKVEL
mmetsp:Transcript_4939/g.5730  ORF Transcript_4939/g.5730 Transcript_4939/m.5730 type:complete len:225 (+) Transcript_4939:53-727(+)